MHVCHIAEVETAEVYALKTMAVTKHGVDVRDIVSLQVADVFNGFEIFTPGSRGRENGLSEKPLRSHSSEY